MHVYYKIVKGIDKQTEEIKWNLFSPFQERDD